MVSVLKEKPITLAEAALVMKLSEKTVRKLVSVGKDGRKLEVTRYGSNVRTSLEAIDRFGVSNDDEIDSDVADDNSKQNTKQRSGSNADVTKGIDNHRIDKKKAAEQAAFAKKHGS